MNTTGLVRLTVVAPNRRIDLALPERSPLAELLPTVLRHAGEHLADDGIRAGGWVLRRADGSSLETGKTLGVQRVRDGEVLHLTTAGADWPELEYDDLVDAIATGAGRTGSVWAPKHTRFASLACGAVAGLLCLASLLRAGFGPWALAGAGLLLLAAVVLARAGGDGGAGAVLGAVALPFAFAGGGLLLGTPHLLTACAALLLAGVIGLLGVVDRAAVFAGAAAAGLFGAIGAWLATFSAFGPDGAAAVVAAAGLAFSPSLAPLSVRLGRVPMPVLPLGTAELMRDTPQPPRGAVYAAVVRADALLTGLVGAVAAVAVVCQFLLVAGGTLAGSVFVAVLAVGFLLRARLYVAVRQRMALLGAGVAGLACLALSAPVLVAGPALLGLLFVVVLLGLRHSTGTPSPYLGRYAELSEIVLVLALVPLLCWVLDLYAVVRGWGG